MCSSSSREGTAQGQGPRCGCICPPTPLGLPSRSLRLSLAPPTPGLPVGHRAGGQGQAHMWPQGSSRGEGGWAGTTGGRDCAETAVGGPGETGDAAGALRWKHLVTSGGEGFLQLPLPPVPVCHRPTALRGVCRCVQVCRHAGLAAPVLLSPTDAPGAVAPTGGHPVTQCSRPGAHPPPHTGDRCLPPPTAVSPPCPHTHELCVPGLLSGGALRSVSQ